MRAICILLVYSTSKSTHLYSITGNFLIRQVYTQAGRRVGIIADMSLSAPSLDLEISHVGLCRVGVRQPT
jgi:hypothetical protein